MKIKTYKEVRRLGTFKERFNYLKLGGVVGQSTFGYDRYLNQMLYASTQWRKTRDAIIIRDQGCDLGDEDYEIYGKIIIHHMNPITLEDIEDNCDDIYNHEFLICTSPNTHNAIHYGDASLLNILPQKRQKGDTCLWK